MIANQESRTQAAAFKAWLPTQISPSTNRNLSMSSADDYVGVLRNYIGRVLGGNAIAGLSGDLFTIREITAFNAAVARICQTAGFGVGEDGKWDHNNFICAATWYVRFLNR